MVPFWQGYEAAAHRLISTLDQPILTIRDRFSVEVIRIDAEGTLFWRERVVTTDDTFKASMIDMKDTMMAWAEDYAAFSSTKSSNTPTHFGYNINEV